MANVRVAINGFVVLAVWLSVRCSMLRAMRLLQSTI